MPPVPPSPCSISSLLSCFRNLHISSSNHASFRTIAPRTLHCQHSLPSQTTPFKPCSDRARYFSTSPFTMAGGSGGGGGGGGGGKGKRPKGDTRVALIRYHLQHPKTPRPLRFSRMRALRHWTIHRAWMLLRRKRRETEEKELYRMYQSMHSACEALRLVDPPGTKDAGRLYRIAMEKKGVFGKDGVPIEYARYQTDTPATQAWNHDWTR